MALKKLPQDVQSILSASVQINTFRKAVEELVYNALDAESTSIAIRLHIQDNTIQVIDNGNGILKHDFKPLGQNRMTSKIMDLSTFRSAPKTYGYRGESLANIIIVSRTVNIISRHKDEVEVTWIKTFHNGKEKIIAEISKRPSKGTTVEIKGFLYNLNIQKKTVDSLNELQNIKMFLEHISLVHSNISFSLRDDSKNEILFNIHKKRDIYQTLSSLFGIKENEIQELQVEKNNYKVRGFIGKADNECNLNWIYVNGKFIYNNSELHKIVNDNFKKTLTLKLKYQRNLKSKKHTDENHLFKKNAPCYFIFLTCPYIDYAINETSKQSLIEFKNWDMIKNLLEKLVKFYLGDIDLKEICGKPYNQAVIKNQENNNISKEDTRDQVKKIMNKFLGSNSKKLGVSQLHKGIKGKLIKRNEHKKLTKKTSPKPSKQVFKKYEKSITTIKEDVPQGTEFKNLKYANIKKKTKINKTHSTFKKLENNIKKTKTKNRRPCIPNNIEDKGLNIVPNSNKHVLKKGPKQNGTRNSSTKKFNVKLNKHTLNDCKNVTKNFFIKFEKDFESVEKRSRIIAEKAERYLKNNVKNTKHKEQTLKINPRHNNDVPLPPKFNENYFDKYIWMNMKQRTFKTTYDLVQTILRSQQELYFDKENNSHIPFQNSNCYSKLTSKYCSNVDIGSKLTFDSHHYVRNQGLQSNIGPKDTVNRDSNMRFITKQSRDNFTALDEKLKCKLRNELKQRRKVYNSNRLYDVRLKKTIEESVYTIEYSMTASNNKEINSPLNQSNTYEMYEYARTNKFKENILEHYEHNPIPSNTYTISPSIISSYNNKYNTQYQTSEKNKKCEDQSIIRLSDLKNNVHETYDCVVSKDNVSCNKSVERDTIHYEKNQNIIFVSKSQTPNMELTYVYNVDALNMCETILDSPYINTKELMDIFNTNNKLNDSLFQNVTNAQENSLPNAPPVTIIEDISHHFSNIQDVDHNAVRNVNNEEIKKSLEIIQGVYEDIAPNGIDYNNELVDNTAVNNNFDLKDRLRFLPKGMSQIFAICNSKTACDYNLAEDYYEDSIYNNFANDVQANVETYDPIIQNVKEFTTANVQKVNDKLNKENASLIFDGMSLEEAKVLGQIDYKFIAAVMKQRTYQSAGTNEYLVLFDQHAVHERIRLEKNLAGYLSDEQWKSVSLDNIALYLHKDDVLYLHNYKEKFNQLGLQWSILGNAEISISAIPEAILGKNVREVENVIKAVRNLIKEEINIIKMQKGCLSLYPKSIMDLVFSEACRYAIKFGDTLSKTDCKDLLQALAKCKTPFQCAHGRPVMAVLMEVGTVDREYKVDIKKTIQFMLKRN